MFSVVIPLYNKEHTIERALQSVFAQSFMDFEVIIVNDGSTDNGVGVVKKYSQDKRLKIIEQKNLGVSVARNNGVKMSQYDYIAFLDADDEWEYNFLEKNYEAISRYPNAGMLCSAGYYKDDKTNDTSYRLVKRYEGMITIINYFENPHVFTHTSATVIKKNFFKKTEGFPIGMKKNQDVALFYSIALISDVVYIGIPLSYYYGNVEFQATQVNKADYHNICRRINLNFRLWDKLGREDNLFKVFLKYELRHILLYSIKESNYKQCYYFLENLDKNIIRCFPKLEIIIYRYKLLKPFAICYLYLTKIIWRTRGFPRIGSW